MAGQAPADCRPDRDHSRNVITNVTERGQVRGSMRRTEWCNVDHLARKLQTRVFHVAIRIMLNRFAEFAWCMVLPVPRSDARE